MSFTNQRLRVTEPDTKGLNGNAQIKEIVNAHRPIEASTESEIDFEVLTLDQIEQRYLGSEPPEEIIEGLLRRGDVAVYAGEAKRGKTFQLIQLALAVSRGDDFLSFKTKKSGVLVIDLELRKRDYLNRVKLVSNGEQAPSNFYLYSHRDTSNPRFSSGQLAEQIAKLPCADEIGLIVIDPLYALASPGAENDPKEMDPFMLELSHLGRNLNCAVLLCHHFPKGNRSNYRDIDRMGGSSVISRAAETLITASAHAEPDCVTLEFTCRHYAQIAPFVIRRKGHHFVVDNTKNPAAYAASKQSKDKAQRVSTFLSWIPDEGLLDSEIPEHGPKLLGVAKSTVYNYIRDLIDAKKIRKIDDRYFRYEDEE